MHKTVVRAASLPTPSTSEPFELNERQIKARSGSSISQSSAFSPAVDIKLVKEHNDSETESQEELVTKSVVRFSRQVQGLSEEAIPVSSFRSFGFFVGIPLKIEENVAPQDLNSQPLNIITPSPDSAPNSDLEPDSKDDIFEEDGIFEENDIFELELGEEQKPNLKL